MRALENHALYDALALPGCPVCRLEQDYTARLLNHLLYENVNDSTWRDRIRQAFGLCYEHSWMLARQGGAALGVSIITQDILTELQRALRAGHTDPGAAGIWDQLRRTVSQGPRGEPTPGLAARLVPNGPCPICVHVAELTDAVLSTLCANLPGEEGWLAAYSASDGLCLPHFRRALERVPDIRTRDTLVGAQDAIWHRLEGRLREFIRKSDRRLQKEITREEADAWRRAIATLVGERPVSVNHTEGAGAESPNTPSASRDS